eukprot:2391880-Pyramimonas_sp.AAC.1
MPRSTLLASRVPWGSWASIVLLWQSWRSHTKNQSASWGLRAGFPVEGFLWSGPCCTETGAQMSAT